MSKTIRKRFWLECTLAGLSLSLAVLTLVRHDWIELLVGLEPDGGDGSFEWGLVAILLVAAGVFSAFARIEWRRWRSLNRYEGTHLSRT